jgi:hypothetical protein
MYTCVYIQTCIYVHIYAYIYIYAYMYIYIYNAHKALPWTGGGKCFIKADQGMLLIYVPVYSNIHICTYTSI